MTNLEIILAIFAGLASLGAFYNWFRADEWRMFAIREGDGATFDDSDSYLRSRLRETISRYRNKASAAQIQANAVSRQRDTIKNQVDLADRRALMADAQLRKTQRGVERTLKRMAAEREGK